MPRCDARAGTDATDGMVGRPAVLYHHASVEQKNAMLVFKI